VIRRLAKTLLGDYLKNIPVYVVLVHEAH